MEVRADDIQTEYPAGTDVFDDAPSDLQGYLAWQVHPGGVVSLVRASEGGPGTPPRYIVEHEGTRIGVTSDAFEYAMRDVMPAGRIRNGWPESIEDLYVDCVEAVCGSEAAGRNGGLGWSGVWLRPRIVGLGKLNWGKRERR